MNDMIKRQRGLSMVELLVVLLIGSFLIIGITQVYLDNKRSYAFQQSQANNLDNGRFATLMLNHYLGKAGYRRDPSQLVEIAFPAKTAEDDCQDFKAGHAVTGFATDKGTGFCIRYQPQVSGELDCQGTASDVEYDEAFKSPSSNDLIVLAFKYDLSKGRLLCKSLNAANPQYEELLTGIADLRLDFGVGSADVLEKEVTTFVPQADWTSASGAIRSLRYSLLLASQENQRDSDDSKVLADWLANAPAATKTRLENADKKRLYQVANSIQTVRNFMP